MDLFLNVAPLVMVAASMAVSVYLFVSLKREIHGSETRRENAEARLALELEALAKRTQEIERELAEAALPPRRSPRVTHLCSVRVTHMKNSI
jgi:hypothetical protein